MRTRPGLFAAVLATVFAAAAPAHAAGVSVPRACFAEGDRIAFRGTGFTAGGPASMMLTRPGRAPLARDDTLVADAAGNVAGTYRAPAGAPWFGRQETRFRMTLGLADATAQGVTASTAFWFSRWTVRITTPGGRLRPGRAADIHALGFASQTGRPLYAHWLRSGTRRATRRLGVLRGACGTLRARLRDGFPFRPVLPGTWHVTFNTSPTNPRAPGTIVRRAVRVRYR